MNKIQFETATIIKPATVTVAGQEIEVNPAEYEGKTPLNPAALNLLQDNIEKDINSKYTALQELINAIKLEMHPVRKYFNVY